LRALKNTGSPSIAPILMSLVEAKATDKKSALVALEVLSGWNPETLRVKIKQFDQHLLTLLKDPERDLSIKSTAIEMLLNSFPTSTNLQEILNILKTSQNKELKAIVLQRWSELSTEPQLAKIFR
jgi:hypothetical protein